MNTTVTTAMGFRGYPVLSLYADGSTRLDLRDCEDHSPLATCTANCVTFVEPDCVIVKDYSENAGMAKSLLDAGVVTEEVRRLPSQRWSFEYPVMRLNPELAAVVTEMKERFFADEDDDNE